MQSKQQVLAGITFMPKELPSLLDCRGPKMYFIIRNILGICIVLG